MDKPLVGLTARRLADGRVAGWQSGGAGERAGYMERVRAAGGVPVLLDPAPGAAADADEIVARLDAIILTGGPDVEPDRYGEAAHSTVYGTDASVDDFEFAITRSALMAATPLLAICRGIQVLNVVCGGTLHQHIPELPGVDPHGHPGERDGERLVRVAVVRDSRLAQVLGTTEPLCSCHHHQAVDQVGEGLRVVGRADDGTIEAIEPTDPALPVLAVQWHPEDTAALDPAQQALFDGLVELARTARNR